MHHKLTIHDQISGIKPKPKSNCAFTYDETENSK